MHQTPPHPPEFIYKVTTGTQWNSGGKAGLVPPMPIDEKDGYMHFSTAGQLRETLALHFKGQGDLMLLTVPLAPLAADVKWEPSRGGALFPHLYAPLPVSSVSAADPIAVDADGSVDLPDGL